MFYEADETRRTVDRPALIPQLISLLLRLDGALAAEAAGVKASHLASPVAAVLKEIEWVDLTGLCNVMRDTLETLKRRETR